MAMKYLHVAAVAWLGLCGAASAQPVEPFVPFIGQVLIFAGNFCPRGWAPTDGTVLPINRNLPLFSILGAVYGGDGQTTFALPNNQPIVTISGAPLTQCIAINGAFPSRN
jgi:microcystin-dependent protein